MKAIYTLTAILLMSANTSHGYEEAYERTGVDEVEVKEIPAGTILSASGAGDYFKNDDGLFMKLFRYIDGNEIKMTVPVEAEVNTAQMRFHVGAKDAARKHENQKGVVASKRDPYTVASAGLRGGYKRETFERGAASVAQWLEGHGEWQAVGEPYAVYWNGPFVPGLFKRSEVHQRIERVVPVSEQR